MNNLKGQTGVGLERWFAALTAVIVALVGGRTAWQSLASQSPIAQEQQRRIEITRVPRREQPLDIKPTGAYRDLLSDEELGPIVATVDPCWEKPNVGQFLHSLRLWGPDAPFDGGWQLPGRPPLVGYSPREQLKILLEHPEFDRVFVDEAGIRVLLGEGQVGVWVTTNQDSEIGAEEGQYHVDDLLDVLAEIGAPATTPVVPRPAHDGIRRWTIADILNESLWKFSPSQEAEFTTSAYSRWLRPPAQWENRFGEPCSLDDLVNILVAPPKGGHPCVGTHIPYALVSAYRANQVEQVLSPGTVARVEAKLREISQRLVAAQHADGSWSTDWSSDFGRRPNDGLWFLDAPLYPEIYATGHHLEWIALAPQELAPPREVVRRAVDYLKGVITTMPQPFFHHADVYPLGTHAVRALCLLRGVTPAEIRRRYPVVPKGVSPQLSRDSSSKNLVGAQP